MTQSTKSGKIIVVGLTLGSLGAFAWWALRSRTGYYDAWMQDKLAGSEALLELEAVNPEPVERLHQQSLSVVEHATTPEEAAEGFRQILEAS